MMNFTTQLKNDVQENVQKMETIQSVDPVNHNQIINLLLDQIGKVNFRELAELRDEGKTLSKKHYLVSCIEQIQSIAIKNNWGLCYHQSFVYLYNGVSWKPFDENELQSFLGKAAEKMGIDKFEARHYAFREQLHKQFLATAILLKPEQPDDVVYINLKNGTFEISSEKQFIRPPRREDFIKYQLPFDYNPDSKAPLFQEYLDRVLPDNALQKILAEYIGYLFVKTKRLKLEKALMLYGSGANGKSVFFEVINALLGQENVATYSLQNLTSETGTYRAMLGNKLVNYASEISRKFETSIFKQLVSNEPVEARLLYGNPFTIDNYAKFIFNINELPQCTEQTNAYFRRFLIVPFNVTIPEEEQDKQLATKIITAELSGVFNWVLEGLNRLLTQNKFTQSDAVDIQLEEFKTQTDNVRMFLQDEGYEKDYSDYQKLSDLYTSYKYYCTQSGYYSCSVKNFSNRLKNDGFNIERKNRGNVVWISKTDTSTCEERV